MNPPHHSLSEVCFVCCGFWSVLIKMMMMKKNLRVLVVDSWTLWRKTLCKTRSQLQLADSADLSAAASKTQFEASISGGEKCLHSVD